jgi:hypothetical protein
MKCPNFKSFLFLLLIAIGFQANGQKFKTFWTTNYNRLFPNNKNIQLEKLQAQNDSLQHLSDSLDDAQLFAIDKINYLKKEITNVKTELFQEKQRQRDSIVILEGHIDVLRDSIAYLSFPIVTCKEEVIARPGLSDPELMNTCVWRQYEIIENGMPDAKGRYSWSTSIADLSTGEKVVVTNQNLFQEAKVPELETKINERLAEDFKALLETDALCFKKKKDYTNFLLKDMRISISDASEITFEVIYGLPDECFAVNAASTTFKISELRSFFVE